MSIKFPKVSGERLIIGGAKGTLFGGAKGTLGGGGLRGRCLLVD